MDKELEIYVDKLKKLQREYYDFIEEAEIWNDTRMVDYWSSMRNMIVNIISDLEKILNKNLARDCKKNSRKNYGG